MQQYQRRPGQFTRLGRLMKNGKLFLCSFCLAAQKRMRTRTTFPLTESRVIVWVRVRVRVLLMGCSCAHSPYIHSRNMQTPCRKRVDHERYSAGCPWPRTEWWHWLRWRRLTSHGILPTLQSDRWRHSVRTAEDVLGFTISQTSTDPATPNHCLYSSLGLLLRQQLVVNFETLT